MCIKKFVCWHKTWTSLNDFDKRVWGNERERLVNCHSYLHEQNLSCLFTFTYRKNLQRKLVPVPCLDSPRVTWVSWLFASPGEPRWCLAMWCWMSPWEPSVDFYRYSVLLTRFSIQCDVRISWKLFKKGFIVNKM